MILCDYGCGQEAKYQFKNGKWCCNKSKNKCPILRRINSENNKGKRLGFKHSENTKIKMSKSKIGVQVGGKNHNWKGGYNSKNIPLYDTYKSQLFQVEECKRNNVDNNILEVKCTYCGKWYIPTLINVFERIRVINGKQYGEQRFYCSKQCKLECPIYKQVNFPKGFKQSSSREVQPELRQMRFEIDNYTCQKCKKHQDKLLVGLHCHHLEGIKWEPLESADVDKVITLCKNCHKEVHKKIDCGYHDMKC